LSLFIGKQRYVMGPNLLTLFCNDVYQQQIGLYVLPIDPSEEKMQEGIRTFCRISCLNTHFYTTVVNGTLVNDIFWFRVAQMLGIGNDGVQEQDTKVDWYKRVKNRCIFIRNVTKHIPRIRYTSIPNSGKKIRLLRVMIQGSIPIFLEKRH